MLHKCLQEVGGRAHMHLAPGHVCRSRESAEVKGASHYDVGDFMDLEADTSSGKPEMAGCMAAPGACPVKAIDLSSRQKAAEIRS